ncbi:LOW QUALITY PROTEIN: midasin [Lethenteron reissneri]|uniref:LOW QUALITY PROTEIN: midasin n=1 Tax=Lethenteron reissneri TaxID=7753 RepID=UPI002AB70827|nr:LOW QUALITY PROTEIN: midasin [Lethenteron reissneri]
MDLVAVPMDALLRLASVSGQCQAGLGHLADRPQQQAWSPSERGALLDTLSALLLEPDSTLHVARALRPLLPVLLERLGEESERRGEESEQETRESKASNRWMGFHERFCVALGKLLPLSPDAVQFAERYFKTAPPAFVRLSHGGATAAKEKGKRKRSKLIPLADLMEASYRLLKGCHTVLSDQWDWSVCVPLLQDPDSRVRWYTANCLALLCAMSDRQRMQFLSRVLSEDELISHRIALMEESAAEVAEGALTLVASDCPLWSRGVLPQGPRAGTGSEFLSSDLSERVVPVCGIVLPRNGPGEEGTAGQTPCPLVPVPSTCALLRALASAVASRRAALIEGPVGCGKTALVERLAALTGRTAPPGLLTVQLGDQTDSRTLLGMYRCTDVPGEFTWRAGALTQAVSRGDWILLEDIDYAPLDVISVLIPLLESGVLSVPGRGDCVRAAPGFQLFATRRLHGAALRRHAMGSHDALLDKACTRVRVERMARPELKEVLMSRFSLPSPAAERLLLIYCQLTGDEVDSGAGAEGPQMTSAQPRRLNMEGRVISLRDLLKWCQRVAHLFKGTAEANALCIFQEALDCFCAVLSQPENRQMLAEIIGFQLNIIREKVEFFCRHYKPEIVVTETTVTVGRATLPRQLREAVTLSRDAATFAATRPSAVLLEQVAVCVAREEPVLLVGETGTGKTSTVQHLATSLGRTLRVINMNQQSDTADLLGGYKPVDARRLVTPLREAFEELFARSFSSRQNSTFLGHLQTCVRQKRWSDLVRLMLHVQAKACGRNGEHGEGAALQAQWEALGLRLAQIQRQMKVAEKTLLFSFVEGSLAQAVRAGDWVLLDEINLASAETLECLSGLLEGSRGSLVLLDRGDTEPISRHPDFRLFACMNPATDVGKRDLPPGIRNRFTELYVDEIEDTGDLGILISDYLKGLNVTRPTIQGIISFYLAVRKVARESLVDSTGHRPHFSLRTLCRALQYAARNPCGNLARSLYEGFCLSFLTQLDRASHPVVEKLVCKHVVGARNVKALLKQPLPDPCPGKFVQVEGYWLPLGDKEVALDPSYILTASVRQNLKDIARVVAAGRHPVLLQGETSVGKTSLVRWLAGATGNACVRINNHEHTDLQEYLGSYVSDRDGRLVFREGLLITAMRRGHWIVLDELNLAPTDVLEALNRLLDDNRELLVAETQEVVRAHPRFTLFATQNPPGLYGGRKVLSRAFRNRFVELHFDELPSPELQAILHQRCHLPPSYCAKLAAVMADLQAHRRGSSVFAGKHGFITLRDLFRWAERYRLAEHGDKTYDWQLHLANDGYMLLAGRVRKEEEASVIRSVLEKNFKRKINPAQLFSLESLRQMLDARAAVGGRGPELPEEFRHVVWTSGMRRLAVLLGRALRFKEPVLLVGETGCGKTTLCQIFAALAGQKLHTVNCHLHMETSDFLGGLRPVRHQTPAQEGDSQRLFEWHDGPLVLAMRNDGAFLMDEISLADDSVLERLNSVLEVEKSLLLAEKGSGEDGEEVELVMAGETFCILATMNPGGDFGKKELSPALRNRFTEIWCPQTSERDDMMQIVRHNLAPSLFPGSPLAQGVDVAASMLDFIAWLSGQDFGRRCVVSARDLLAWALFVNAASGARGDEGAGAREPLDVPCAFAHGACLVYVDGIGSGTTAGSSDVVAEARASCLCFLRKLLCAAGATLGPAALALLAPGEEAERAMEQLGPRWGSGSFGVPPFHIPTGPLGPSSRLPDYALDASTTARNAQRVLRALQLGKPVLLEGSPGVGKTSLVAAVARAAGHELVRINLSEQTDVTDLFGTDLPVEGGQGGQFAWRDGPLLAALKAGHWVVLDELNLASQSVLEGLNACFDHRAEVFVPELGMTFHVQRDSTRIFGCQNPLRQGGGRKGLPRSFLNRFTQVYVDEMSGGDMEFIANAMFPNIGSHIVAKMVEFNNKMVQAVTAERRWGQRGGPWEFNLRDVFRWCQLLEADQDPGRYSPGRHVTLVYADRMRSAEDRGKVYELYREVFTEEEDLLEESLHLHVTPALVQAGFSCLRRHSRGVPGSGSDALAGPHALQLLPGCVPRLASLLRCVEQGWMVLLVGPAGAGKSALLSSLAALAGRRLRVMAVNSDMDTTELLGGFEQVDARRPWLALLADARDAVASLARASLPASSQHAERLLRLRTSLLAIGGGATLGSQEVTVSDVETLHSILGEVELVNGDHRALSATVLSELRERLGTFQRRFCSSPLSTAAGSRASGGGSAGEVGGGGGAFEWVDGVLVEALRAGDWLLMDNVNFCSPSVLDRLNALLEPGGVLTISERGVIDGTVPTIVPHPDFRLFLSMDPVHGEISRAMRNRGVEIFLPVVAMPPPGGPCPEPTAAVDTEMAMEVEVPAERCAATAEGGEPQGSAATPCLAGGGGEAAERARIAEMDLKLMLLGLGVVADSLASQLIALHRQMGSSLLGGCPLSQLLQATALLVQQLHRGQGLHSAFVSACADVYASTQPSPSTRQWALETVEAHAAHVTCDEPQLLAPGRYPEPVPSVASLARDASLCAVRRDGALLLHCLAAAGQRGYALTLGDLRRSIGVLGLPNDQPDEVPTADPSTPPTDNSALLPFAARLVAERASPQDWLLRVRWLNDLANGGAINAGQVGTVLRAASEALNAVSETGLVSRIVSCQQHLAQQAGDSSSLADFPLDIRWNLQYLEVVSNRARRAGLDPCPAQIFSLANRMSLLLERKAKSYVESLALESGLRTLKDLNSSVLKTSYALSKGALGSESLPHPAVAFVFPFLSLWDDWLGRWTSGGKEEVSDEDLTKLLQRVQRRDWFWEACEVTSCEQGMLGMLALHWHWLRKAGCGDETLLPSGCPAELTTMVSALDQHLGRPDARHSALSRMRKSLGWPLPFKQREAVEVALGLSEAWSRLCTPLTHAPRSPEEALIALARLRAVCNRAGPTHGDGVRSALTRVWEQLLLLQHGGAEVGAEALRELTSSWTTLKQGMLGRALEAGGTSVPGDAAGDAALLALESRVQLWPVLEQLALRSQCRLVAALLNVPTSDSVGEEPPWGAGEDVRHLVSFSSRFTPSCPRQLGLLHGLLGLPSRQVLPSVRWDLLLAALSQLWSNTAASRPELWLGWKSSTDLQESPTSTQSLSPAFGAILKGPGVLSCAALSGCLFRILGNDGHWSPQEDPAGHVTLGAWQQRTRQLEVVGRVVWSNMSSAALPDFTEVDRRLLRSVLRVLLSRTAESLSPASEPAATALGARGEASAGDEERLADSAARCLRGASALPADVAELLQDCVASLGGSRDAPGGGQKELLHRAELWAKLGLVAVLTWRPRTQFDPMVKRAQKLRHTEEELHELESEWRARETLSHIVSGRDLRVDSHCHPRIRFVQQRMEVLRERVHALSKKQAHRPEPHAYERLSRDVAHFVSSICQPQRALRLLARIAESLSRPSATASASASLLREEAAWQTSLEQFRARLAEGYAGFPDVVTPLLCGVAQLQHGVRLAATELRRLGAADRSAASLVSCLAKLPSVSAEFPSFLAHADALSQRDASRAVADALGRAGEGGAGEGGAGGEGSEVARKATERLVVLALLFLRNHMRLRGEMDAASLRLLQHLLQVVVNAFDDQERLAAERAHQQASVFRYRSQGHGSGLSPEEQEERDFRRSFPQHDQDFADLTATFSLDGGGEAAPRHNGTDGGDDDDAGDGGDGGSPLVSEECTRVAVLVHAEAFRGLTHTAWYRPSGATAHPPPDHMATFAAAYQLAGTVMAQAYPVVDASLERDTMCAHLLMSKLIRDSVAESPGGPDVVESSRAHYDFYQSPNAAQALQCLPPLKAFTVRVSQLLDEWPEHPTLSQLVVVMTRILGFSLSSPLSKFLYGLELLLAKAQDWESNASRAVSLRPHLDAVTQLIIQFRKLELSCWAQCLDSVASRCAEKTNFSWFSLHQLVENGTSAEDSPLASVASTLQAFMEGATLGEFPCRLDLLLSFHCQAVHLPPSASRDALLGLLWNLHQYYSQFSESVRSALAQKRKAIEKELKDFVKICRWNDASFWAMKEAVNKTHRTLFRFSRKFEEALSEPCRPALTESGPAVAADAAQSQDPVAVVTVLRNQRSWVSPSLQDAAPGDEDSPQESLQGRLPVLSARTWKFCQKLRRESALPDLIQGLDHFTGEVASSIREMQVLSVNPASDKDKQRSEAKQIQQQKQRALAELFRLLRRAGLSYRKGLTVARISSDDEWMSLPPVDVPTALRQAPLGESLKGMVEHVERSWTDCQRYFYRSVARRCGLRTVLTAPSKDMGPGNLDRCRGFSEHLLQMLVAHRKQLTTLTEQHMALRQLIRAMEKVGGVPAAGEAVATAAAPPVEEARRRASGLLRVSAQVLTVLEQTRLVLRCCPQHERGSGDAESGAPGGQAWGVPSPVAPSRLPPAASLVRDSAAWVAAERLVSRLLSEVAAVKSAATAVAAAPGHIVGPTATHVLTWDEVDRCGAGLATLGSATSQMGDLQCLFMPPGEQCPSAEQRSPVADSIAFVRDEVQRELADFTTWRTQTLSLQSAADGDLDAASQELVDMFSADVEGAITAVLCAVQALVARAKEDREEQKRADGVNGGDAGDAGRELGDGGGTGGGGDGESDEGAEPPLRVDHISAALEGRLWADVRSLALPRVLSLASQLLQQILNPGVGAQAALRCRRRLSRALPLLGAYADLTSFYLLASVASHRALAKLLCVLLGLFTELVQKGFCQPAELTEGKAGEGPGKFQDVEGGGIGAGEGVKDVSDQIENEDQVEDTFQRDQQHEEEPEQQSELKDEENAIEMSEDFQGKLHDGELGDSDDEGKSDEEEKEELDKQMGNLGEGPSETLDERMWGDDEEEEGDEDGDEGQQEESGPGMDEEESELVAQGDNEESGENKRKDDKKREQQQGEEEEEGMDEGEEGEKKKINEQKDERDFDENESDPYQNQQKPCDPEPLELPDDLALDKDQEGEEGGDQSEEDESGDNPLDIEERPMELDKEKDSGKETEEGEAGERQEDDEASADAGTQQAEEEEEKDQGAEDSEKEAMENEANSDEVKEEDEEGEGGEERGEGAEASGETEEGGADEDKKEADKEDERREETAAGESDRGMEPKGVEEEEEEDEEAAEERAERATDGEAADGSLQSELALERAGSTAQEEQGKEEYGTGAAESCEAEGHESDRVAPLASRRDARDNTQSYKRKPGEMNERRTLGDREQDSRANKRLKTVDAEERTERQGEAEQKARDQDAELYQHMPEPSGQHDRVTFDAATLEQQELSRAVTDGAEQQEDEGADDAATDEVPPLDEVDDAVDEELRAVEAKEMTAQDKPASCSVPGKESTEPSSELEGATKEDGDVEMTEIEPGSGSTERSRESTFHTSLTALAETEPQSVEVIRQQLEQQLEVWRHPTDERLEEARAASEAWQRYIHLTSPLAQQLCEHLRLILEPTQAAKLRGDFRTGKRLNMRKVIPYVASGFRKDKIWLRRTQPSKRRYQVCVAVDDSSSMLDNHSKQLAFESLAVIGNALSLLEVGQIAVCSFGETMRLLHPFHEPFTEQGGAAVLRSCTFQQKKTHIAQFLEEATRMFLSARQNQQSGIKGALETSQLLLVVSDGRGLFLEGKQRVQAAIRAARDAGVFLIFVALDNPDSKDSLLDIKVPIFGGPGTLPEIRSYMDEFPFPFYVVLRDVNALPETLSDALRQWFELVTASDH